MKSKKLLSLFIATAVFASPLVGTSLANATTINKSVTTSSSLSSFKFSSNLKIYSSSKVLAATLVFNSTTNEINVDVNHSLVLGNNNGQSALMVSLYKPKSFIPYKTITLSSGENINTLKAELNNVKFDNGDLLTVYTNKSVSSAVAENGIGNTNEASQSFILTKKGLENYSTAITLNKVSLNESSKDTLITGSGSPDAIVDASVNGVTYKGIVDMDGSFSISVPTSSLNKNSNIEVSSYFGTPVKAVIETTSNLKQHKKVVVNTPPKETNKPVDKNKINDNNKTTIISNKKKNSVSKVMKGAIKEYGLIINPVNVISNDNFTTTKTAVTGYAAPNSSVEVTVYTTVGTVNKSVSFSANSDASGYFSIPIDIPAGIYTGPAQPTMSTTVAVFASSDTVSTTLFPNFNEVTLNNTTINPVTINSTTSSNLVTFTGKICPNTSINLSLNNKTFKGKSNSSGEFSIATVPEKDMSFNSTPEISFNAEVGGNTYTVKKAVPVNYDIYNIQNKSDSGFKYSLNNSGKSLSSVQTQLAYYDKFLNENEIKALNLIYSSLLSYNDKTNSSQYLNLGPNTVLPVNFIKNGIQPLTMSEVNKVMNIVSHLPRTTFEVGNMFPTPYVGSTGLYNFNLASGVDISIYSNFAKGDTYQKTLQEVNYDSSKILANIKPNMNEYQIIATIEKAYSKDYIYDGSEGSLYSQSMLGTFISHKSVCAGIAQGMSYLLNRVGIECIPAVGFAVAGQPDTMHEWDYVDIYGKWYLIDNTWQTTSGTFNTWYLAGQNIVNSTNSHEPFTIVPAPTLQSNSINYNTISAGTKIVNLMGCTGYKINNNNTITITYNDENNVDKNVQVNLSSNNWKGTEMTNNGKGLWSVTLPYNKASDLYFYFTVNNTYGTAGNVAMNNLQTSFKGNGITAVKVQ